MKLNEATISAAEAKASSTMDTIAIQEIWSEMNILKKECLVLKRENEEFKKQSNDMETYSRKITLFSMGFRKFWAKQMNYVNLLLGHFSETP